jgi:hypothetical protein
MIDIFPKQLHIDCTSPGWQTDIENLDVSEHK